VVLDVAPVNQKEDTKEGQMNFLPYEAACG